MITLVTLDFVLRIIRARMMRITLVVKILCMDLNNPAADVAGLRVPRYVIANAEFVRHGGSPPVGATCRLLIVGQAPGARVHATGIPWDDRSGERLRTWLGMDSSAFNDESRIAIIPMGYCYPSRGKGGDLAPRRECAELWLQPLLTRLPQIELTLLIGQHAQRHFLGGHRKQSLTATIRAWREYAPQFLPLPHPSPRNAPWFKRNPWFEEQVVPVLQARINALPVR